VPDKHPTRREVLARIPTAAVASSLGGVTTEWRRAAAAEAPDPPMRSDRKVRIGVVGGGFGSAFHWHEHPNAVVEAVSDLRSDRRDRLMRVYRCDKSYDSLEKLVLDKNVDAVAIFTGAPDHARHVVLSMKAGKHCISAVPACLSLEEAEEMREVKEKTGLRYMMAETSCYRWETLTAKKLYADGQFGEIFYTEAEYYHNTAGGPERQSLWYYQGKPTWRYGYPPMLYVTHATGFLVGVTGERLVRVSCLGWADDDPAYQENAYRNPFTNQMALFQTERGNICRCGQFRKVHAGGERAQWFGTKMTMYMAGDAGQPFVIRQPGRPDITQLPNYWHRVPRAMRRDSGHGASHPFLTHEFITALVEDREPAIDLYESLAMTVPGILAHHSSLKDGEQMRIPDFGRAADRGNAPRAGHDPGALDFKAAGAEPGTKHL